MLRPANAVPLHLLRAAWLAGAFLVSTTAGAQSAPMQSGRWEIVKRIESSDPAANGRTVTTTRCFSADDVRQLPRLIPSQRETDERCTVSDVQARGAAELTWKVRCQMPGVTRTGTGSLVSSGKRFEASAKLEGRVAGKAVKSSHAIVGTRTGDCP